MKMTLKLLARGAVGLVLGVSLAAGCADAPVDPSDEAGSPAATEDVGQTEESLTSVDMVDCSICDTARECCKAVSAANGTSASSCVNFDGPRCDALDPGRQRTTKIKPGVSPRRHYRLGADATERVPHSWRVMAHAGGTASGVDCRPNAP